LLRCARNDGVCGTGLCSPSVFIADISSRSRGGFRPSFAAVLRPILPKGAGKAGRRRHPSPCTRKMHTGWTTGVAGRPAFPARLVLTVSFVLSSGSVALLPPSPCGWLMRVPGWAAASPPRLDARTPGVRTTRLRRPRTIPPKDPEACVCSPSGINETAVTAPCRMRVAWDSRLPALSLRNRAGATASTAPQPASRDDREAPLWKGPG